MQGNFCDNLAFVIKLSGILSLHPALYLLSSRVDRIELRTDAGNATIMTCISEAKLATNKISKMLSCTISNCRIS